MKVLERNFGVAEAEGVQFALARERHASTQVERFFQKIRASLYLSIAHIDIDGLVGELIAVVFFVFVGNKPSEDHDPLTGDLGNSWHDHLQQVVVGDVVD